MRRTYKYNGITLGVFIGITLGFLAYGSNENAGLGIAVGIGATIGLSILFVFLIDKFERSLNKGAEMVWASVTGKKGIQSSNGSGTYVKKEIVGYEDIDETDKYRIPLDSTLPKKTIIFYLVATLVMGIFSSLIWNIDTYFDEFFPRLIFILMIPLITFAIPVWFSKKNSKLLLVPVILGNPIVMMLGRKIGKFGNPTFVYNIDVYGRFSNIYLLLGLALIILFVLTLFNILKDKKYLLLYLIGMIVVIPIAYAFAYGVFAIDQILYYFVLILITIALSKDKKKKYHIRKKPIYEISTETNKEANKDNPTQLLHELNELRKSGAISEKEFNEKKKKLLDRI